MGMKDTILADIKDAMKAKDSVRLSTLRMLSSTIKNREIELRPESITEQDILAVIKKLCKQRRESIEQFAAAGRQDLVDQESSELAVLQSYLPKAPSREELEQLVGKVIAQLGATTIKDMGPVIKEVAAQTQGTADNKLISELVRAKLQ